MSAFWCVMIMLSASSESTIINIVIGTSFVPFYCLNYTRVILLRLSFLVPFVKIFDVVRKTWGINMMVYGLAGHASSLYPVSSFCHWLQGLIIPRTIPSLILYSTWIVGRTSESDQFRATSDTLCVFILVPEKYLRVRLLHDFPSSYDLFQN